MHLMRYSYKRHDQDSRYFVILRLSRIFAQLAVSTNWQELIGDPTPMRIEIIVSVQGVT